MGNRFYSMLLLLALISTQIADTQEGKTLFGDNRKATYRAMKAVAKSLDVKCTFCHLKSSGKYDYVTSTPHKTIARQMKISLVDSLLTKGSGQVVIPRDYGDFVVTAQYASAEDGTVIILTTVDPTVGKEAKGRVELPPKGEELHCMTCHQGKLHFMSHSHSPDSAIMDGVHTITNSAGDPVIQFTFDWGSSDEEQRLTFAEKVITALQNTATENPTKTRVVWEGEMKYKNRHGLPQKDSVRYIQSDLAEMRRYSKEAFLEKAGRTYCIEILDFLSNQGYNCTSEQCVGPNW